MDVDEGEVSGGIPYGNLSEEPASYLTLTVWER